MNAYKIKKTLNLRIMRGIVRKKYICIFLIFLACMTQAFAFGNTDKSHDACQDSSYAAHSGRLCFTFDVEARVLASEIAYVSVATNSTASFTSCGKAKAIDNKSYDTCVLFQAGKHQKYSAANVNTFKKNYAVDGKYSDIIVTGSLEDLLNQISDIFDITIPMYSFITNTTERVNFGLARGRETGAFGVVPNIDWYLTAKGMSKTVSGHDPTQVVVGKVESPVKMNFIRTDDDRGVNITDYSYHPRWPSKDKTALLNYNASTGVGEGTFIADATTAGSPAKSYTCELVDGAGIPLNAGIASCKITAGETTFSFTNVNNYKNVYAVVVASNGIKSNKVLASEASSFRVKLASYTPPDPTAGGLGSIYVRVFNADNNLDEYTCKIMTSENVKEKMLPTNCFLRADLLPSADPESTAIGIVFKNGAYMLITRNVNGTIENIYVGFK